MLVPGSCAERLNVLGKQRATAGARNAASSAAIRREAIAIVAALPIATRAPPTTSALRSRWFLTLEDGSLCVVAEHLLQGLDDLALRRVRAGAGEQRLHQVALLVRGVRAQGGQRCLDGRAVAPGARGLQPADLLALQRGVD